MDVFSDESDGCQMGAMGATLRIDALRSPEDTAPRTEEFTASSHRLGIEAVRITGFAGFSLNGARSTVL